jgi:dihydroorotate dehydrogenase electron transfer subunit
MHAGRAAGAGLAGQVKLFYGGRSAADLVLLDAIATTGVAVELCTEDGSRGSRGYVTAAVDRALAGPAPTLMACGPEPMLVAVARLAHARGVAGYLSLEGEMACGIGACLACAVPCRTRAFRYTCKDGPVLPLDELLGPYRPLAAASGARP